jgi:hypothetical protein
MIISYLVGRRFLVGVMADRRLGSLENKIEEKAAAWCGSHEVVPK